MTPVGWVAWARLCRHPQLLSCSAPPHAPTPSSPQRQPRHAHHRRQDDCQRHQRGDARVTLVRLALLLARHVHRMAVGGAPGRRKGRAGGRAGGLWAGEAGAWWWRGCAVRGRGRGGNRQGRAKMRAWGRSHGRDETGFAAAPRTGALPAQLRRTAPMCHIRPSPLCLQPGSSNYCIHPEVRPPEVLGVVLLLDAVGELVGLHEAEGGTQGGERAGCLLNRRGSMSGATEQQEAVERGGGPSAAVTPPPTRPTWAERPRCTRCTQRARQGCRKGPQHPRWRPGPRPLPSHTRVLQPY